MFFLFILIFLLILLIIICTTKILIIVENLQVDTELPKDEKINSDSKVFLYIIILWKIPIYRKNIRKISFENQKKDFKTFEKKYLKKYAKFIYRQLLQSINYDKFNLFVNIGIQDAATNAILVGIASSLIAIAVKGAKYEVIPAYSDKNFLKINLNCELSFQLLDLIKGLIDYKKKYINV